VRPVIAERKPAGRANARPMTASAIQHKNLDCVVADTHGNDGFGVSQL
jgi:hypothetical protein